MIYRKFGRTGLDMPVFSCGGMRYQESWNDITENIPDDNQKNLEATIERAIDLGIYHIETARGYGSSEYQLGKILPRLPREKIIVQTKVAPSDNPKEFGEKFERSMELLKLDYVDLLSVHGINREEHIGQSTRKGGCLDLARTYQKQGRVRHIGFSTHASCGTIRNAIRTGEFDYVNLHWYYIFQENWPAVQDAAERDMGIFIISPSDKGGMLYKPTPKLLEICSPLTPMQFNDLFCLSRPEIHTLSLGASRPTDFDEHVASLDFLGRADELLPPIQARWEKEIDSALGEQWRKCFLDRLPSWENTPGHINLPVILRLYTLAKSFGMIDYGKMRYNLLGNGGHWFPGQNAAEATNLDLAPCLAESPFADSIPGILRETHDLLQGEEKKRLSHEE